MLGVGSRGVLLDEAAVRRNLSHRAIGGSRGGGVGGRDARIGALIRGRTGLVLLVSCAAYREKGRGGQRQQVSHTCAPRAKGPCPHEGLFRHCPCAAGHLEVVSAAD